MKLDAFHVFLSVLFLHCLLIAPAFAQAEILIGGVEMESEAFEEICRERLLRLATVRVISDAARDDLPLDFNQLSRPDWSLDYGKLAWSVARSPGKIPAPR